MNDNNNASILHIYLFILANVRYGSSSSSNFCLFRRFIASPQHFHSQEHQRSLHNREQIVRNNYHLKIIIRMFHFVCATSAMANSM